MHVADGILSGMALTCGTIAGIAGVGVGLRRLSYEDVPKTALMAAVFFVASLIHVPIGPAQAHIILTGLAGIVLGWAVFPALLVALFLQALLFGYGGVSVLFVNTALMAWPALACHYVFRRLLKQRRGRKINFTLGALAGALAILGSSLLLAGVLYISDKQFWAVCIAVLAAHIPVMFVEGVVTGSAVVFLAKVSPEIFGDGFRR